jgi:hypothetical protein
MAALPPGPTGQKPSWSSRVDDEVERRHLRLSYQQVRRHFLTKQHLTLRTAETKAERIAEDLVGLHATGTTSPICNCQRG